MKQKHRYRKKTKGEGLVRDWPLGTAAPEELATRVHYQGSSEHKARPIDASYSIEPCLRSDASRCPPTLTREAAEAALQRAVRLRNVSAQFEGGYPRYAWARIEGRPYIARLINQESGAYKGWPIEEIELPTDRDHRLALDEDESDA